MAFRTRNYWEDDKNNKNRPPVTVDSSGQPFVATPTPADLNPPMPAAPQNDNYGWQSHNPPVDTDPNNNFVKSFLPFLATVGSPLGLTQLIPAIATSGSSNPQSQPDMNALQAQLMKIAGAGTNAANDAFNKDPNNIANALHGIFNAGANAAESTPEWLLNWLQESAQQAAPTYNGPTPDQMAQDQFNPLYQALDKRAQGQENRYNDSSAKAKQAYADYVASLRQGQQANKQMYADTGKQLKANYGAAADTVSSNATDSFNGLSDTLQRLGIQEGADTLAKQNQTQVNQQLGHLAQNQQTSTDLNSQLGANTFSYDTDRIGLGQQAGLNYQGDLLSQYTDMMNQNDQQRLQLQSQQGQAKNDYMMQIQKLLADQQGAIQNNVSDQFKTLMQNRQFDQQFGASQNQNAFENQLAQGRLDLDATKAGIGVANPFDQLQTQVGQKVGAANAQQYMTTIMNAMRDNPQATNAAQLLASMSEDDLRKPYMAQLAYAFFEKALNKGQ